MYETLFLAAKYHLPVGTFNTEINTRVMTIAQELGLANAVHTIIGGGNQRGVSGGERKRVSIGKDFFSSPDLIFLDEPTSGLDAFQALSVVELLRNLTREGRIVVAVLHQPSSTIYDCFAKLLLLSNGRTMYFGTAAEAVSYFQQIGYPCPVGR